MNKPTATTEFIKTCIEDVKHCMEMYSEPELRFIIRAVNGYEKDQEIKKELLEALKGAVRAIEYLSGTVKHELLYKAAIQAIAKAEGK